MGKTRSGLPPQTPVLNGSGKPSAGRRVIKPRARRDQKKGLRERRRGFSDDHTINPNCPLQVELARPNWFEGALVFRPYPALLPSDPTKLDPYRITTELNEMSDFVRNYPAVWKIGKEQKFTYLICDPAIEADAPSVEAADPYAILWDATHKAADSNRDFTQPTWIRLIKGKAGSSAIMPAVTTLTYFQGAVYQLGKKLYFGKDKQTGNSRSPRGWGAKDRPQLIQLKGQCGTKLIAMFNEKNTEWTGKSKDWANSMLYGNVVSPKTGRFIRVFNEKVNAAEEVGDDVDVAVGAASGDSRSGGGGGDDFDKGYTVSIDKTLVVNGKVTSRLPALSEDALSMVMDRLFMFDEVLWIPSVEEKCLMIARALAPYAKVLRHGWKEHEEFFTADVEKVLRAAVQVSLGGSRPVADDDDDDDDDAEPEVKPAGKKTSRSVPVEDAEEEVEDDDVEVTEDDDAEVTEDDDAEATEDDDAEVAEEEAEEEAAPPKKSPKKSPKKVAEEDDDDDEDDEDEDDEDDDGEEGATYEDAEDAGATDTADDDEYDPEAEVELDAGAKADMAAAQKAAARSQSRKPAATKPKAKTGKGK